MVVGPERKYDECQDGLWTGYKLFLDLFLFTGLGLLFIMTQIKKVSTWINRIIRLEEILLYSMILFAAILFIALTFFPSTCSAK